MSVIWERDWDWGIVGPAVEALWAAFGTLLQCDGGEQSDTISFPGYQLSSLRTLEIIQRTALHC